MRNHRYALKAVVALGLGAAVALATSPFVWGQEKSPQWKSSALVVSRVLPTPRDQTYLMKERSYQRVLLEDQQLHAFASAVEANAASVAARSARTAATASTSRTTTTTTSPVVSGADGIPAAWMATAICEEGGRNDPNYGYFGIIAWGGFDGYPCAGAAPLSVQLAWEAAHGQGPPDAPGQCHSY